MPTHRLPCPSRRLSVPVVALLLVIVAACGSDDDTDADAGAGTDTTPTTAAQSTDRYPSGDTGGGDGGQAAAGTIVAQDFSLTDITVGPGEEIVLDNQGAASHTATADEGAFDLGLVTGGETSAPVAAPDEPGSYPFHCEIHIDMTATLTVEG